MGLIGTSQIRVEDGRFLRGDAHFTEDLFVPGAAYAHFVGSPVAHGRLAAIDVAAATPMPGVLGVYTAADVSADLGVFPSDDPIFDDRPRPWLADRRVRFVGEAIAVVVAETAAEAADAADLVLADIVPLPALLDPLAAAESPGSALFEGVDSNVCWSIRRGEADFSNCDVVVQGSLVNQRVNAAPMEARAAAASWEGDHLTLWATTQGVWPWQRALVKAYGLPSEGVRVISTDVGGGFGSKEGLHPEILLLPWLARRIGRPVRWAEPRSYAMLHLGHGRAQIQHVTIGGTRDGRLLAYQLDVVQDSGAYPRLGAVLPSLTMVTQIGPYRIPSVGFSARSVVTNTPSVLPYRGAGQPEACSALEWAIDRFAAEVAIDPADVRRSNLLRRSDFPHRTPNGFTYDHGHPDLVFEAALTRVSYEQVRMEQRKRRASGDVLQTGIGLASYIEVTGATDKDEWAEVEVGVDGRVLVRAGSFNHGQGHATVWAMIVADRMGIPIEQISTVDGDTAKIPQGGNTGGSRSVQTAGNAVALAADDVVGQARSLAADLLEAAVEDIVVDVERGCLHVAGAPSTRLTWATLAAAASERGETLRADAIHGAKPRSTFSGGAHVAVVEVDTETGAVRLLRFVAVGDAGRILNPMLAEGQMHGGVAQGVGQALTEAFVFDPEGNPRTATFADYGLISAVELPSLEVSFQDEPDPFGPLGAKGLGESGAIGAAAAVRNAVVDALRPFGVVDVAMPCHGEAVWLALRGR